MATKKEIVFNALKNYGCSSAKQLSCYIKRTTGEDISPASVSGQLRSLVSQAKVSKSNLTGVTTYWVVMPDGGNE